MAIQGGGDRSWLRPHNDGGDEILGSHRGNSEALNIKNPQPGFHYTHARRDASYYQRKVNEGYVPITASDPEKWGVSMHESIPEMDGIQAFKDVIAMKIPEEKFRIIQEEKARRAKVQLDGPTSEFLDKGADLAERVHSEDDLYFKRRSHGYYIED